MMVDIRQPDADDALQYIVQALRSGRLEPIRKRYGGGFGYGLYLPFVMMAYAADQGHPTPESQPALTPLSSSFFAAAWELCRRGILRPGITRIGAQGTDNGRDGDGYSITPYGEQWLAAADESALFPTEPGRFAKMLAEAGVRFGPGFVERSQEAVKAYHAHTFLACCAMCGAAAESIVLALAVGKTQDEKRVLDMYLSASGRRRVEDSLLGSQPAPVRDEFHRYTTLLKYWRDNSAHGRAVRISEPEAYSSLALLLRFALWAESRWAELTI